MHDWVESQEDARDISDLSERVLKNFPQVKIIGLFGGRADPKRSSSRQSSARDYDVVAKTRGKFSTRLYKMTDMCSQRGVDLVVTGSRRDQSNKNEVRIKHFIPLVQRISSGRLKTK